MRLLSIVWTLVVAAWAIGNLARMRRRMVAREGIERELYRRATSLAFVATMVAAVVYGTLESSVGAPAITMWWVWTFGISGFAVTFRVLMKRAA